MTAVRHGRCARVARGALILVVALALHGDGDGVGLAGIGTGWQVDMVHRDGDGVAVLVDGDVGGVNADFVSEPGSSGPPNLLHTPNKTEATEFAPRNPIILFGVPSWRVCTDPSLEFGGARTCGSRMPRKGRTPAAREAGRSVVHQVQTDPDIRRQETRNRDD